MGGIFSLEPAAPPPTPVAAPRVPPYVETVTRRAELVRDQLTAALLPKELIQLIAAYATPPPSHVLYFVGRMRGAAGATARTISRVVCGDDVHAEEFECGYQATGVRTAQPTIPPAIHSLHLIDTHSVLSPGTKPRAYAIVEYSDRKSPEASDRYECSIVPVNWSRRELVTSNFPLAVVSLDPRQPLAVEPSRLVALQYRLFAASHAGRLTSCNLSDYEKSWYGEDGITQNRAVLALVGVDNSATPKDASTVDVMALTSRNEVLFIHSGTAYFSSAKAIATTVDFAARAPPQHSKSVSAVRSTAPRALPDGLKPDEFVLRSPNDIQWYNHPDRLATASSVNAVDERMLHFDRPTVIAIGGITTISGCITAIAVMNGVLYILGAGVSAMRADERSAATPPVPNVQLYALQLSNCTPTIVSSSRAEPKEQIVIVRRCSPLPMRCVPPRDARALATDTKTAAATDSKQPPHVAPSLVSYEPDNLLYVIGCGQPILRYDATYDQWTAYDRCVVDGNYRSATAVAESPYLQANS